MNARANTTKRKTRSLLWAIVLSAVLAVMKGFAALICASSALLASALDSVMDVGISLVNFISVREGSKPPDEDHAYGHEKIESLASYTQGWVILTLAFLILVESVGRFFKETAVVRTEFAFFAMIVSCLGSLVITLILARAEKQTKSTILHAEKTHYLMDVLSNVVIFMALFLISWTGWNGWDSVGGICVALYEGQQAIHILIRAGNELVDRSLPDRTVEEIESMIRSHENVLDYHNVRTRKVGQKVFIDFHLVMPADQPFRVAHETTEALIQRIRNRIPGADVTVHEDPEGAE